MGKISPSISAVLEKYKKIAGIQRLRTGKPEPKTVDNAIGSVRRLCELGSINLDEPINVFTEKKLTRILDSAIAAKLKAVTIWSYLHAVQAVTARWTRAYYADMHWSIPTIELPSCTKQIQRYVRPDKAILSKVKEWYVGLITHDDKREWVAATLMIELAMRNGDVGRLRWADFRERDGGIFLCYTPHKTAHSSQRHVCWPVHPDIWRQFSEYREAGAPKYKRAMWEKNEVRNAQLVVPCANDVFARLNKDLRTRKIFTGAKGCYELRKICVDHIYQKFGAEMASSISGDDIRTMMRYYADPSQPNVGNIRIVDLL